MPQTSQTAFAFNGVGRLCRTGVYMMDRRETELLEPTVRVALLVSKGSRLPLFYG